MEDLPIVPPRTITNGHYTKESYKPTWNDGRPGAQDHEAIPSRQADGLHYRDGRKEPVWQSHQQ
jgi:hypothetical protein